MPDSSKAILKKTMTPLVRACLSLGLEESFQPTTKITHVIAKVPGGARKAFDYLHASADPEAVAVMALYDKLTPVEKRAVTIDHLVAAAKIEPRRMFEIIAGEMFAQSAAVTNMVAALAAPDIMKKRVEMAKKPEGHLDAKMILQSVGAVPVPRNQVSHVSIVGNRIDNSKNLTVATVSIPALEDVTKTVGDILNEVSDAQS